MQEKHLQTWEKLNERQRAYLGIIYRYDQRAEEDERARWRWHMPKRPASEWRWLSFDTSASKLKLAPDPALKRALKNEGLIDEGAGSTFNALESRKLIKCREDFIERGGTFLSAVQLTKLGRAVARAGLGEEPPKRLPKGQLKERQWEALAAAYVAGDEGVQKDENLNYGGFSWEWTWLRLRDYYDTGRGLIKERRKAKPTFKGNHEIVLTDAGREFYRENWQRYRELYPDVDTPDPDNISHDTGEKSAVEAPSVNVPIAETVQQIDSLDTSDLDGKERRKQNLKPFEGKWKLGKTRTIRVPEAIADKVLEYARQLDEREGNP